MNCSHRDDTEAAGSHGVDAAVRRVRARSEGLPVRTVLARLRAALDGAEGCPPEETLFELAVWISRGELTDAEVVNARYDTSSLP